MLSSLKCINDSEYFTVKFNGKVFIKTKKQLLFNILKNKLNIKIKHILKFSSEVVNADIKLKLVDDNKYFKIFIMNKIVMIIDRKLIKKFFITYFYKNDVGDDSKLNRFINYYLKEYKRITKRKFVPDYSKDKKSLDYFKKCMHYIEKHNVSFKVFLDSQIEGMQFIKQPNFFPKPYNLCTSQSEIRLMDYLDKLKLQNEKVSVNNFDFDDLDLDNNKKYKKYLKLIKIKEANFEQTNYVYSLQKSCLDKIDNFVKNYYNTF